MKARTRAALTALVVLTATVTWPVLARQSAGDTAVRAVLDRFYDGWNTHNVDKMVSAYADDVDHINVFGKWHKGKEEIRKDLALVHGGPSRDSHKAHVIEKVRLIGSTVAIVQVSSKSQLGLNLGTYVLEKRGDSWLIVSFTNVIPTTPPYKQQRH